MGRSNLKKAFPVYLYFLSSDESALVGVARLISKVSVSKAKGEVATVELGAFGVKWIFVRHVPNAYFCHIRNPRNNNRIVTMFDRITEIPYRQGCEMLKVFHNFKG